MYVMVGVIAGGRLGYVLFYEPLYYIAHPTEIVMLWDGGMSFHGGALGVAIGLLLFCLRHRRPFLEVADLLVPAVPIGLGLGRLGNFINSELCGLFSDSTVVTRWVASASSGERHLTPRQRQRRPLIRGEVRPRAHRLPRSRAHTRVGSMRGCHRKPSQV